MRILGTATYALILSLLLTFNTNVNFRCINNDNIHDLGNLTKRSGSRST